MQCLQTQIGIAVGDVLLGKYLVERVLGVGGMGAVVAARHLKLEQTVAIKVLLPEVFEDGESVARFEREARAAARIKSDHIVKVNDVGALDDGTPYMVMEYLEGEDLETLLRRRRSLPIEQAVDLAVQACEALSQAHALGIVHRDLKPANLFCVPRPDGRLLLKVLDFGISKTMTENLTTVRGIMGSPAYMPPEQIRSAHTVDERADIWAMGVVLYEMLTGLAPFHARTLLGMLTNVATQPTPSIRRYRLDVPAKLEAVIQTCLEKDPAERYASAAELAEALAPFSRDARLSGAFAIAERGSAPPSSRSNVPVVFTSSRNQRVSDAGTGNGWLGAAAAVLIALAGVLGTLPPSASATAAPAAASHGAAVTPSSFESACLAPAPPGSARRLSPVPADACDDAILPEPGGAESACEK